MLRLVVVLRSKNPFEVLGLTRTATKPQIKVRYRELARVYHPDAQNGDSAKMEKINKAYNLLLKEGLYERMHRKQDSGSSGRNTEVVGESGSKRARNARSYSPEHDDADGSADSGTLSEEEVAKVGALDLGTERRTPQGKFMYQNRDSGEWVTLNRAITGVGKPRYSSFSARADMAVELRRRATQQEREQNEKTPFDRTVDKLADSADLPSRNKHVLRLYIVFLVVVFYLMYERTFARGKHQRRRAQFYQDVEEQREVLMQLYEERKEDVERSVLTAAILFLAASQNKRATDPVVPPREEEYFHAVQPPREHFHVVAG